MIEKITFYASEKLVCKKQRSELELLGVLEARGKEVQYDFSKDTYKLLFPFDVLLCIRAHGTYGAMHNHKDIRNFLFITFCIILKLFQGFQMSFNVTAAHFQEYASFNLFSLSTQTICCLQNNQTNLILHVMLLLWLASKIFNSRQQSENPSELLTLKQSKDVTGWVCLILLH